MSGALDMDVRLSQGDFRLDAQLCAPGDGITALFGPSGSGKSSLLALAAGLKRADGKISIGSRLLADSATRLQLAPHKRGIGLVFQDARLFPHLSVRRNIAYAWDRAPRHLSPRLEDLAGFFDLFDFLDRPTGNLSGGEKNRVALCRAVAAAPDFLLLDEPFAALDGLRRRAFITVLRQMHQTFSLPMLVVTHNIDDAAALAAHLVALKAGRVVAAGPFAAASATAAFRALLDSRDTGAAVPANALRSARHNEGHVWLRADHVLLAGEPPRAISARNILPGEVQSVDAEDSGSQLVTLQTEAGAILSRLTAEAVQELSMTPGRKIWALVKAHTL